MTRECVFLIAYIITREGGEDHGTGHRSCVCMEYVCIGWEQIYSDYVVDEYD